MHHDSRSGLYYVIYVRTGDWVAVWSRVWFHYKFFHHNSGFMEISFCFYPNSFGLIVTQLCTWHNSCAVMSCFNNWLSYDGQELNSWTYFPPYLYYNRKILNEMGLCYSMVNFLHNAHNKYSIAHPWRWGLWDICEAYRMLFPSNCSDICSYQYCVVLDHVSLTHWGLVTPFGDIDLVPHWLR